MVAEAIQELKERDQWVAYSRSKVPVSPRGRPASSTDPETWGTLDEAKFIRKVQGLPGVGFVFSDGDPYVGIDLDDAIDPDSGFLKPWAQEVVERVNSYTELSPSGMGVHIWVRGEIPRNGARVDDGRKLEIYQSRRYFTVTGQHLPGTPTEIADRDLGPVFEDYFDHPDAPEQRSRGEGAGPSADWDAPGVEGWLGDALSFISPDPYHTWIRVGMALKNELGEAGYDYWDAWSAGSEKYDGPEATARKWASFSPGGGVSIATVVWMAERQGFDLPGPYDDLPAEMQEGWDEWIAAQEGVQEPEGIDSGLNIVLRDAADMYEDESPFDPDLIGPGVLGPGDIGLIFGPPKSMKSMIVMDMCRQFAMGRDWCGFTVDRPIKTVFGQFELKADKMRERLQLADLTGEELDAMRGNLLITDRFTPVFNAEFVRAFSEVVGGAFDGGLDLLVLDPLANIYTGDSENDNAQMSKFIRQIKILRNAIDPEVAILLVHHANKVNQEDREAAPFQSIRGASALRGAYDSGILVNKESEGPGRVKLWSELRNGPGRAPFELIFQGGRFHEADAFELTPDDVADLEPDPAEDEEVIREILAAEAAGGNYYTTSTFAETFSQLRGLPSATTIKRTIREMATRQELGWFRSAGAIDLAELHHRSRGFLCFDGMVLKVDGLAERVTPDLVRDPRSGRIVEADSV